MKVKLIPFEMHKMAFGNSGWKFTNFLGKFVRFFLNLRFFYGIVIHRKQAPFYLYCNQHHHLIISTAKSTLSQNNLKILRLKVTKNLTNLQKKIFLNFKILLWSSYSQKIGTALYDLKSSYYHPLLKSTSKSTLSLNNLKISRPNVTKNLTNLPKKFCEFPH